MDIYNLSSHERKLVELILQKILPSGVDALGYALEKASEKTLATRKIRYTEGGKIEDVTDGGCDDPVSF